MKQILMCRNEAGLQQGRVHRAGVGRHCPVERSYRVERWSFWFPSGPAGPRSSWAVPIPHPQDVGEQGGAKVQVLCHLYTLDILGLAVNLQSLGFPISKMETKQ